MIELNDGLKHINPNELIKLMKTSKLNVIDIREVYELRDLPFLGAKNIPLNVLISNYNELLDKNELYYIICHHGQRSYVVTEMLQNKGYNVINVIGGIDIVN